MKKQIESYIEYCNSLSNTKDINKDTIIDIKTHISFYQHERLIHLLITLFIALCALLFFVLILYFENIYLIILFLLFILLFIPYILHYYFLENSIQKLYIIYEKLYKESNKKK